MRARAPGHDQGGRARRWGTCGRPYAAQPAALAAACPRPPWHAQWGGSPGGGPRGRELPRDVGGACRGAWAGLTSSGAWAGLTWVWAGLAGVPGRGLPPMARGRGSPL